MSLYRIQPNALWGWDGDEYIVEIDSAPVGISKRVFRILVNREPVGFVIKRSVTEWDHLLGTEAPNANQMISATYPSSSRLMAVTALVEAFAKKES